MNPSIETAAICGLFCGTCPAYPKECEGCLSARVAAGCDNCGNGFRDCAAKHGVSRCFECVDFPCARLENFSKQHIVNGICHHRHVIEDLKSMGEIGVESWVEKQTEAHSCPGCGKLIPWFHTSCPRCKP